MSEVRVVRISSWSSRSEAHADGEGEHGVKLTQGRCGRRAKRRSFDYDTHDDAVGAFAQVDKAAGGRWAEQSVVAEAVDEAAVALGGAVGGGDVEGAVERALGLAGFGGLVAGVLARGRTRGSRSGRGRRGRACSDRTRTSTSKTPASEVMWRVSPRRTSRADLAGWPLDWTRFRSQALEARARVLKKRAAQSHLSMRVPVMGRFYVASKCRGRPGSRFCLRRA